MITGIVVALAEELTTLTAKKLEKGCIGYLNDTIWIVYSGAGAENARIASELLVKNGANRLISWGCAAALEASMQPGDLLLADSCVDASKDVFDLGNKDWVNDMQAHFSKQLSVRIGRLAESKAIVETNHEKAQIWKSTGAIALDMESVAVARVAKLHDLPFLTIRAIADPLNMDLPKAVSHAVNDQGEVKLGKLLVFLLLHPAELPGLIKLGMYFHAAKSTLKRVATEMDVVVRSV